MSMTGLAVGSVDGDRVGSVDDIRTISSGSNDIDIR